MPDAVRTFLVRTILEDLVSGKLDQVVAKATSLTGKAYTMTVQVATKEAEKTIADLNKAAAKASKVDSSQAVKAHRAHAEAARGLGETMKSVAEQSRQASDTMGGFFTKLDAGKLVMAGAAAGLSTYAASLVTIYEGFKLNLGTIKDQLGTSSSGLMSFIGQGGQTSGTSESGRAGLLSHMSMTGYRDEKRMQNVATDAEKIMHSTLGRSLAEYGITDEKSLIKTLSSPMDENSDIGRIVKSKMPSFFKAGTLATEQTKVRNEEKFAYQSNAVVEAEARRRLMERATKSIAEDVTPDTDSYRLALDDMGEAQNKLSKNVGQALEPALVTITKFTTFALKMASAAPGITTLAGTVVTLGIGLATLGAILPLVQKGVEGVSKSMLTNPMFLAAAAVALLAVGLVALESKTKIFSKAWDHFANSEIGKDLIAGVKQLLDYFGLLGEGDFLSGLGAGIMKVAGFIGNLFDQFDAIYKMVKGGDIAGALKGGLALALKISPVGMTASFVEALRPGKRVQDMILYVLQKMKDLWDGFTRWLTGIWEVVDKLLAPILKLKEYLQGVYEKMFGGEGKSGSALTTAVSEEIKKNPAFAGLSEAQQEYLARTASGEKYWKNDETGEYKYGATSPGEGWRDYTAEGSTQISMGEAIGISSNLIDEAKKIADNLKNPKGMLNSGGAVLADAAYNAVKTAGDDVANKLSDLTGTTVTNTTKESKVWLNKDTGERLTDAEYTAQTTPGERTSGVWTYDSAEITTNALGGDVTKSGIAWVDEGEPIVPAEVARSSTLITSLKDIASSGGSGSNGGPVSLQVGEVHVHVEGQGANAYDIAREVAKEVRVALEKELDDFTFGQKVERAVHRMNRAYTG